MYKNTKEQTILRSALSFHEKLFRKALDRECNLKVELKSIKADGQEVAFDKAKIKYGNIEDNNNCYRIEIYNDYGDTAKDSPIDKDNLAFEDSLEITFSIEGLSE